MAYLDSYRDDALKPRLLQSLLRDHRLPLPDEGGPSADPSRLLCFLHILHSHSLLSGPHQASLDAWIDRVISLASSNMLESRLIGIGLLGITCAECNEDLFLKSYSSWFQKLLSNIQPLPDSSYLRMTLCVSLSDLFSRLTKFASVKKDATSLSTKIVQPLLQLMNKDSSDVIWVHALDLFNVLVNYYPSSVLRHADKVEAIVISKIISAKYNEDVSMKLAGLLASLPRTKGDKASLSLMFKKVLIAIASHLEIAFQGLEEGNISSDIKKLLNPPGEDILPPLGGYSISEEATKNPVSWLQEILVRRVSTLCQCCGLMITDPFPSQVIVPIHILLKLVKRVLLMDGSLHGSLLSSITSLHQECICCVIPDLHSMFLDLLSAIVKGLGSQLLPHAATIAQILTAAFDKVLLSSTRIKLHQVMQQLLISSGAGMAFYLYQGAIKNSFLDLNSSSYGIKAYPANDLDVEYNAVQIIPNKRKHGMDAPIKFQNGSNAVKANHVPLCVQIEALRTLDALLNLGGSLKSEFWFSDVHLLLMKVAENACGAAWGERNVSMIEESDLARAQFQLAALQALLSSILSFSHARSPYLSEALELFHKGKVGSNPEIASLCSRSLRDLEVLIHPISLPWSQPFDYTSNIDASGKNYSRDSKISALPTFSPPGNRIRGNCGTGIDDDDFYSWKDHRKETVTDVFHPDKRSKIGTEPDSHTTHSQDRMHVQPAAVINSDDCQEHVPKLSVVYSDTAHGAKEVIRDQVREEVPALRADQVYNGQSIKEQHLLKEVTHNQVMEEVPDLRADEVDNLQSIREQHLQNNTAGTLGSDVAPLMVEAYDDPTKVLKPFSTADTSKEQPLVFPELKQRYDDDSEDSSLGPIPPLVGLIEADSDSSSS